MFDAEWSLKTERLLLRSAGANDVPFLTSVWTDARVRTFLGGSITKEEATRRIWPRIDARELLLIADVGSGKFVGLLGVSDCHEQQLELSYLLAPEHWNRGYATEAVTTLIRKLRSSFSGYRLFAITQAANAPSRNLLLRLGFREEHQHIEFDAPQIKYGIEL